MLTKLLTKPELKPQLTYLLCCVCGVIICYVLYKGIPNYPFYWAIVSVVLALSPDNSTRQAFNRIKANVLGCAIGICFYPLHLPELLILCAGVAAIVIIGLVFKIADTLRSALAAFIIVTVQVETGKYWYIMLERVVCVVAGCAVALALTLLFNLIITKSNKKKIQRHRG